MPLIISLERRKGWWRYSFTHSQAGARRLVVLSTTLPPFYSRERVGKHCTLASLDGTEYLVLLGFILQSVWPGVSRYVRPSQIIL